MATRDHAANSNQNPAHDWNAIFWYEAGQLFWRESAQKPKWWNTKYAGKRAGTRHSCGYRLIITNYKHYFEHRIIYEMHNGPIKNGAQIDHINGIRSDNRIENLRAASQSQNNMNYRKSKANTSGYRGVSWCKRRSKFKASITVNGKNIYLGLFDDPKEAGAAYKNAARNYFGEYAFGG